MNFPYLKTLVLLNTYGEWPPQDISPYQMANAHFAMLFRETHGVAICLDCSLTVTKMTPNCNPLVVHIIGNPTCPFILRNYEPNSIKSCLDRHDVCKILERHLYLPSL